MLLDRFHDDQLAQTSYLLGCEKTGEAIVVDPARDVERYVRAAAAHGLRIAYVTETHIHADFVSGSRELAARTGAALLLSGEGGEAWGYRYPTDVPVHSLRDGDSLMVGRVRLDVRHTPGHTPEHLTFLVTDTAATDHPMGALTGDFLFVGDVGRPDLLERAAGHAGTMDAGARMLFRSLRRFASLPDWLQLWPGHGAGSACGRALGAVPQTTLGYERIANWALAVPDEDAFVRRVLEGQPEPPPYFARMKRINREGPRVLGAASPPPVLAAGALAPALAGGDLVVDTRSAAAFAAAHVPGTLNIPLNRSFAKWAGWLLPYDRDLRLIVEEAAAERGADAVRVLASIGLDRVAGLLDADAVLAWHARQGEPAATIPQLGVDVAAALHASGAACVVDVRDRSEWDAGHIPGAVHIPLGALREHAGELPHDRPVVVHCQGGSRSAIAASLLRTLGVARVSNLAGGYREWAGAGAPVTRDATSDDEGTAAVAGKRIA